MMHSFTIFLIFFIAIGGCLKKRERGPRRPVTEEPIVEETFNPWDKPLLPITTDPAGTDPSEQNGDNEQLEEDNDPSLVVEESVPLQDDMLLSQLTVTPICINNQCVYEEGNKNYRMECKIEGCVGGFHYKKETQKLPSQSTFFCGQGTETVTTLTNGGIVLKCELEHLSILPFSHKSEKLLTLNKNLVAQKNLCVIFPDKIVNIQIGTCDSSAGQKHKLQLTFNW